MLVWMIRKCVYISVRVLGISPLSAWLIIFSRTVAEIQQKTGMWHMMKRLLDDFRCEMILLARLWSLILFQKYSSFCGSLKPRTSVTRWTHSEGTRSAAAGLEVIQMRAEGSRFPTIRFISSTSTEADSLTSHNLTLLWKSRDRRHSSRPSKTKTTLYSPKNGFISLVSGKKTCRRPKRLSVLSFIKLISLKGSGNMSWTSWFSFPSAQSRMNFCTETVFPMPATPFVSTVLMGLSCPGNGLKMSLHLIDVSSVAALLDCVSICLTSCSLLISPLSRSVM